MFNKKCVCKARLTILSLKSLLGSWAMIHNADTFKSEVGAVIFMCHGVCICKGFLVILGVILSYSQQIFCFIFVALWYSERALDEKLVI